MTIYLYIKKHLVTGLKYFGKTAKQDPHSYVGSGTYWQRHIKKHGKKFVETIKIWEFQNQEEATSFALKFSEENNIVESKEWANLIPENGLDGAVKGSKRQKVSEETKQKLSLANKGRVLPKFSEEKRKKMSESAKNRKPITEETRLKMSKSRTGKKRKPHTDETKRKLSETNKGKKRGPYKSR